MKTMLLSPKIINDTDVTPPYEMLTTLRRFADSSQPRRFITMTVTVVMNASGCTINCFQQPTAAWIVVFCTTSCVYDLELPQQSWHGTGHSWKTWVRSFVRILRWKAVTIGEMMNTGSSQMMFIVITCWQKEFKEGLLMWMDVLCRAADPGVTTSGKIGWVKGSVGLSEEP